MTKNYVIKYDNNHRLVIILVLLSSLLLFGLNQALVNESITTEENILSFSQFPYEKWQLTNPAIITSLLTGHNNLYEDQSLNDNQADIIVSTKNSGLFERINSVIINNNDKIVVQNQHINAQRLIIQRSNLKQFIMDLKGIDNNNGDIFVYPHLSYRLDVNTYSPQGINDTYKSLMWHLNTIDIESAWEKTVGNRSVIIGIIDSGLDTSHPDLQENILDIGYNWFDDNTDISDYNGHGTHVAGIIAAGINNSRGIAGVANISIFMQKAFDTGDTTGDFILANAIVDAVDKGANILSGSWGSFNYSIAIHDAIKYASNQGVISIFSAGNNNTDQYFYPAALKETIAVGATDENDVKASYSNYGSWINLTAPGNNIFSTLPNNNYGSKTGTSMSVPIVAGVIGLMYSYYQSDLTPNQIYNNFPNLTDDLGTIGFDSYYGWGRINANKALKIINRDFTLEWANAKSTLIDNESIVWTINDPDVDDIHLSSLILLWDNDQEKKTLLANKTVNSYFFTSWGLENRTDYRLTLNVLDSFNHSKYLSLFPIEVLNPPHTPIVSWNSISLEGTTFSNHDNITLSFEITELDNKLIDYYLFLSNNNTDYLLDSQQDIFPNSFNITWNSTDFPNGIFNYKILFTNGFYEIVSLFDYFELKNTHNPRMKLYFPKFLWTDNQFDYEIWDYDTDNVDFILDYRINNDPKVNLINKSLLNLYFTSDNFLLIFEENILQDNDKLTLEISLFDGNYTTSYSYELFFYRPRLPIISLIDPKNDSVIFNNFQISWYVSDEDTSNLTSILYYRHKSTIEWNEYERVERKNNSFGGIFIDIDFFPFRSYDFLLSTSDGYNTVNFYILNITLRILADSNTNPVSTYMPVEVTKSNVSANYSIISLIVSLLTCVIYYRIRRYRE